MSCGLQYLSLLVLDKLGLGGLSVTPASWIPEVSLSLSLSRVTIPTNA
jgi:hypothetical protein